MVRRIIQWWIAYFLAGIAISLICFSLGAILYAVALTANGLHIADRGEAIVTTMTMTGIAIVIFCVFFATYTLFLDSSDKGFRNIQPFNFKSFLRWLVGGLIYSTNPSHVLDDFIGFRRK